MPSRKSEFSPVHQVLLLLDVLFLVTQAMSLWESFATFMPMAVGKIKYTKNL